MKMTLFGSTCETKFFLILSVVFVNVLCLSHVANGANGFRRCYNTSMDTHCFDVQYTASNQWFSASFDDARQRCKDLNSTLIIIKDEETNRIVQMFLTDSNNPVIDQYIWTDAYRFNSFDITDRRWQWLDTTLPNISASDVGFTYGYADYVAVLEFRDKSFYLTAKQPYQSYRYVCEYPVSNCSSIKSNNARQINGRCYIATNEQLNWFEARNRCLKGGGDLASFANVTSINFTSWLVEDTNIRHWIGLRFIRYIWKDSGDDVKFLNWYPTSDWYSQCLRTCPKCTPSLSWAPQNCGTAVNVVCHTVTPLIPTTTTVTTTTITTSTVPSSITTSTIAFTSSNIPRNYSNPPSSAAKAPVEVGVGVGVGVGVPVIIAIVLVAIFVIRKYRRRTITQPQSTQAHPETSTAEDQSHKIGGDETNQHSQYAFIPLSSSPKSTAAETGAHSETQYVKLDFAERDKSNSEKDNSPLDVL